jgi:prepilin-type N-terminal cleavage/methylation domain-containing protein
MLSRKKIRGFTLVEVLLATALLALMAGGFATLYSSGLSSLVSQKDRVVLNSQLSSRMEELESREFSNLTNGSEVITVEGESYTINWIVAPVDLDGDAAKDAGVVQVTVSIAGSSDLTLTNIIVNTSGQVGKI